MVSAPAGVAATATQVTEKKFLIEVLGTGKWFNIRKCSHFISGNDIQDNKLSFALLNHKSHGTFLFD